MAQKKKPKKKTKDEDDDDDDDVVSKPRQQQEQHQQQGRRKRRVLNLHAAHACGVCNKSGPPNNKNREKEYNIDDDDGDVIEDVYECVFCGCRTHGSCYGDSVALDGIS